MLSVLQRSVLARTSSLQHCTNINSLHSLITLLDATSCASATPQQPLAVSSIFLQIRKYATNWSGGDEENLSQKVKAIRFSVAPSGAIAEFERYHNSNWFLSSAPTETERVKEVFLPFWAIQAEVQVTVLSARIGHTRMVTRQDRRTGQPSMHMETEWSFVRPGWQYMRSHAAEDRHMQIYASYKYPLRDMRLLSPGPLVEAAVRLTPDMLASKLNGMTRKIHPYTVRPASAVQMALQAAQQQEEKSIRQALQRTYGGNAVDDINAEYRLLHVTAAPVYVPAYVFRFYHYGTKLHTFVSGTTPLKVTGIRVLDEGRVGLVIGATAGVGAALASIHWGWFPGMAWAWTALVGIGVGAWVGMGVARRLPGLQAWYLTAARLKAQEQQRLYEEAESWDAEFVRAYARARQRIDWEEEEPRRQQGPRWGPSGGPGASPQAPSMDPLGYYALLGVSPDATTADIQAAFRGLAMRFHPDTVQGDAKAKATAAEHFKRINQAYSVLRNPEKRRQYDRGERV